MNIQYFPSQAWAEFNTRIIECCRDYDITLVEMQSFYHISTNDWQFFATLRKGNRTLTVEQIPSKALLKWRQGELLNQSETKTLITAALPSWVMANFAAKEQ